MLSSPVFWEHESYLILSLLFLKTETYTHSKHVKKNCVVRSVQTLNQSFLVDSGKLLPTCTLPNSKTKLMLAHGFACEKLVYEGFVSGRRV